MHSVFIFLTKLQIKRSLHTRNENSDVLSTNYSDLISFDFLWISASLRRVTLPVPEGPFHRFLHGRNTCQSGQREKTPSCTLTAQRHHRIQKSDHRRMPQTSPLLARNASDAIRFIALIAGGNCVFVLIKIADLNILNIDMGTNTRWEWSLFVIEDRHRNNDEILRKRVPLLRDVASKIINTKLHWNA